MRNDYELGFRQGRNHANEDWKEKIEEILNEIPSLARYESADGQDLVMAYDVMRLIKEKTEID